MSEGVRSLFAFWSGGAGSVGGVTPSGNRSMLAPWIGGASSLSGATPVGYRSMLAPWAGGGGTEGIAPSDADGYRSMLAFWSGGAANNPVPIPTPDDPETAGGGAGKRKRRRYYYDNLLDAANELEKATKEQAALNRIMAAMKPASRRLPISIGPGAVKPSSLDLDDDDWLLMIGW